MQSLFHSTSKDQDQIHVHSLSLERKNSYSLSVNKVRHLMVRISLGKTKASFHSLLFIT